MERDFDKKLVPIGQAAEFLGVSVDTVRRWDEKGILHSERPDGKDRYFSITELEKIKFSEPLSISEAAQKLNISETTLRRLEEKGLIKPERNAAGERVYTLDCLEDFIRSDYYLRQGVIEDKILNDSDDSPADKADYKEDIQSLREQHKVLNAQIEDHKKHLGKLNNLRKAFYYAGVSLIIFLVMLVVLSTALFIMYPAKTAKWFGYSSISAQAASGVSSTTTTSGASFASSSSQTSLLSKFLQPIGGLSLEVVRRISPATYNTVLATQPINDVNDIFSVNSAGNIVANYNLTFPNSSYLIIPDTTMIKNLNAEMVQGKVPGINPGDLVSWDPNNSIDGLVVNSANIVNNSITSEKLADNSVASNNIADNSITTNKIADGAISQVKLGTISEINKVAGSAVQLSIGGGLTDKVGLSLKTDCNVGEILNWTGSAWECVAQSKSAVTKILTTSPLSYDTASGTLSLDTVKADAWDLAYLHISDTNNPHNVTSAQVLPAQPGQNGKVLGTNGTAVAWISNSSNVSWGAITGTLTDQSDLVAALATKESTLTAGTSGQYYRGDKTWQTLSAATIGLNNVDNTSDLSKPVSTATSTALGLKVDKTTTVNSKALSSNITLDTSDVADTTNKRYVSDAQILVINAQSGTNTGDETTSTIKTKLGITTLSGSNTGDQDLSGLVAKTTTVNGHALSSNVSVTTTDLGLNNVDNTSDLNKPVSTAASTALGLKVDKTITVNSKALSSNITLDASDVADTTNKRYVSDAQILVINAQSNTNTGDETTSTIKTKLGITTLSGSNTGDQDLSGLVPKTYTVNGHALSSNVSVTTTDLGLNNVDNTSDLNKPVSTATSTALGLKVNTSTTVNAKALSGNITLDTSDIADTTNKRYVSDAQMVILSNTSGANTGDETTSTIKTKLGITTLSGSNTGDQTLNSLLPAQTGNNGKVLSTDGSNTSWVTNSSGVAWGAITGTLSSQSDLVTVLGGKQNTLSEGTDYLNKSHLDLAYLGLTSTAADSAKLNGQSASYYQTALGFTPASAAITVNGYALSGNVTLSTADIADSTDKRYVSDTQKTVIGNTSNTNTGDETDSTIKTKLGITTLSGSNTGDQTLNSLLPAQTGNNGKVLSTNGTDSSWITNSSGVAWGAITGTLSDQTDLNTALGGRVATSVTVNSKALSSNITLDTSDVADTTNKRYVSDANLLVIGNTSNTNTGDETDSTIKTKLGITILSGSNTGDQDLSGLVANTTTVNGHALSSNVSVTTTDLGLNNVDNTSDLNKPVSTATSTALGLKVDKTTTINGHALSSNVSVTATDLSLGSVENTALSTWTGTSNIATLGTVTAGVWHGTAITDTYISSAATWNAKQNALTEGTDYLNKTHLDLAYLGISATAADSAKLNGQVASYYQTALGFTPANSTTTVNSKALSSNITLTTADIADSTDKRYVSDAQLLILGNTSGTNTGDETTSTIKTKLGITTLSGSNTGDQDLSGLVPKTTTVNGHALSANVSVTTTDLGLNNVDNTSDLNKPVSTATSTALGGKQDLSSSLSSLAGLTYVSPSFVKMTGANTFTLDTNTYLTSLSGAVLTSQSTSQTIGDTTNRLTKLWTTDLTATNTITGSVSGNAGSVTNATLSTALTVNTGTLTLTANSANTSVLTIGAGTVSVSGSNTGDQTLAGLGGVATGRSLTINGTAYDLSADRTWTITNITGNAGTVTGLSVTTGKTLTAQNSLTLSGTDGSTLAIGTGGTLGTAAYTAATAYQSANAGLTSLASLTYVSPSFVKMTGTNTFALDTNTYLTSLSGAVLTDQTSGQTIGDTTHRLTKLWTTDLTATNTITGSVSGNAGSVTNATLTTALTVNAGTLTLTANSANTSVLTIGAGAVSVSGSNTGDQTLAGLGGVATGRSLTINGTAYDLSADRTWTITNITGNAGTVTGLSVTSGKTLTAQNSLTLSGTDGSTLAIGTGGTLGTAAYSAATAYQAANAGLTSLAGLTYVSPSFVKMTGANTFTLDTSTYLTSLSGAVLTSQATPQTIGDTTNRLAKLWTTDLTATNAIVGSITGNAATVTTNANLTGVIISVGNATSIASQTGTGTKFVVDTSPVLVTPNIGVATGTSLSVSGALSSTGGDISSSWANIGGTNTVSAQNTDNTNAASNATLLVRSGGASGGDARVAYGIIGVQDWSTGIDNSDSDAYVIAASSALGSSNVLRITTGGAVSIPGTLSVTGHVSVDGSTASTGYTGSGKFVFDTSPIFTTPALGTPSSGVATNLTGTASSLTAGNVTTNANLTGVITSVGNATSIASQTGTGTKFVVDTSPTLVTPVLGAATYTTLSGGNVTDSALTAGRVTYAGTAGILKDSASLTYADSSGLGVSGPVNAGSGNFIANTNSLYLPTTSDYISVSSGTKWGELDNTQNFSISYWAKYDDITATTTQFTKRYDAANGTYIRTQSSVLYFNVNNGSGSNGHITLTGIVGNNEWHHFTAVYDGTQAGTAKLALYIDGVVQSLTYSGTLPDHTYNTAGYAPTIGNSTVGSMLGNITDFRVYSTPLSPANALTVFQGSASVSGMVHRYKINEGTGITAIVDSGTVPENGTLTGGTWQNKALVGIGTDVPMSSLSLTVGTTQDSGIRFGNDTNLYRSAANSLKTDDSFLAGNLTSAGLTAGRVTFAGTAGLLSDSANITYDSTTGLALAASNGLALGGTPAGRLGFWNTGTKADTSTTVSGFADTKTVSGTNTAAYGLYSAYNLTGTNTVTDVYGVYHALTVNSGTTATSAYGLRVADPAGAGSVGTNYGLLIDDMTKGTSDYGIAVAGADTAVLWLGSGADNTDAANGIMFGQSKDTNLYRSTTSTLKTDGNMVVAGHLTVDGSSASTGYTGSGKFVFDNSPALVTPALGAATYTTLNGGNITDSGITAGQVVVAGTGGLLQSSTGLQFDGTNLSLPSVSSRIGLGATASANFAILLQPTFADTAGSIVAYDMVSTSGNAANYYGFAGRLSVSDTKTVGNHYGAYLFNPIGLGTISNNYGLYIPSQAKGATGNYPIYLAGTSATGADNAIWWTTDTKLYRSAASTLKTDTALIVGGHVTLEGVTSTGATGTNKFVFDTSPTIQTSLAVSGTGNGALNVGNQASPQGIAHFASNSSATVVIERASGDANSGALQFRKAQGTVASPGAVASGNNLGALSFYGYYNSAYQYAASIFANVDAAPSGSIVPGNLIFNTADSSGVMTQALKIDSTQLATFAGGLTVTGTTTLGSSLNGILKATSGVVSQAVAGTDYGTMANPMTTAGDLIYGGASGAPTRLAAGGNGNVLQYSTGYDFYTKSVLHFEGSNAGTTFTDDLSHTWTANGSATTSTTQKEFGSTSGSFPGGATDSIQTTTTLSDYDVGTADFTIDFWAYLNEAMGSQRVLLGRGGGGANWNDASGGHEYIMYIGSDSKLNFSTHVAGNTNASVVSTSTIAVASAWHHFAAVRSGGSISLYVDGTKVAGPTSAATTPATTGGTQRMVVGTDAANDTPWKGWIDEFRFSNGIARWTSNFTPPVAAYAASPASLSWVAGQTLNCGTNIGIKSVTISGGIVTGATCTTNTLTDMAENYGTADATIVAGDVVAASSLQDGEAIETADGEATKAYVEKGSTTNAGGVIGVVSANPNITLGQNIFSPSENPRPVALSGRVKVKASNSNGPIKKGDLLTVSDAAGVAVKATDSSIVTIGTALQDFDASSGQAIMFVNISHRMASSVFAQLTVSGGLQTGTLTVTGDAIFKGVIKGNDKFAGSITLPAGETNVRVSKTWDIAPLSVVVTPSYSAKSWVTGADQTGFTVNVDPVSDAPQQISWFVIFPQN